MKNKTIKINLLIIVFVIIISILGGILGMLFVRAYVLNDIYPGAFTSELNLNDYNRSNLVIRDAKKVVVNQDVQVKESADQIRESMLTIFTKKIDTINTDLESDQEGNEDGLANLNNFYQLNNPETIGLIISADGWAIINKNSLDSDVSLADNFVAINSDRVIYEIDQQINIENSSLALIHLKEASNLRPISIMSSQDLISGQSLLVLNSQKQIISNFLSLEENNKLVQNSDTFVSSIEIYPQMQEIMELPWLFNFKGQAVAFLEDGTWTPLSSSEFLITNALLEPQQEELALPSLGVNYISLSQTAQMGFEKQVGALVYPDDNGVAVLKDSNADKAGLKKGDVILAINSLNLDKNLSLSEALFQFKSGEVVDLTVLRDNSLQIIKVEL
ncbi:MAG: PDZ domain-containing protein [Parcubacteria group bacterium]